MDTAELAGLLKSDTWRCSMCGLRGDAERGSLTLRVPKNALVHFVMDESGNVVPLFIKLHAGRCQRSWDEQFPHDGAAPPDVGRAQ